MMGEANPQQAFFYNISLDAGGATRGIERAEQMAAPEGVEHGIEDAERRIDSKDNPRNPNTQQQEDTDTTNELRPPRK